MNIGLEKYRYYYEILRDSELFEHVTHKSLNDLLEIANSQCWPKKTCLLDPNKILYKFYIIISGRLKAYNFDHQNDRQLTLFLLTDNDVFDVFTLINGCHHNVYYETLDQTEVLDIPISKMRVWMKENPEIIKSLLTYKLNKMLKLEECLIDVILEDTPTRLAKLLINNMDSSSKKIELINDLSHGELAALIGTTRAVVNRHIQDFKKDGILKTGRKSIEITNLQLLLKKINAGIS